MAQKRIEGKESETASSDNSVFRHFVSYIWHVLSHFLLEQSYNVCSISALVLKWAHGEVKSCAQIKQPATGGGWISKGDAILWFPFYR